MSLRHLAGPGLLLLALLAGAARADDAPGDDPAFKFTVGRYHLSGGGTAPAEALDLNLRWSAALGNAWVGGYQQSGGGLTQARAGWDRTFDVGGVRVQPSLQVASGGFVGGSLYAETGERWFAGVGLGRTDLRPYANLNFDPNDAWTLAGGLRWAPQHAFTVSLVGDNRQNPDQRHLHFNERVMLAGGGRLTADLLLKQGRVEGEGRIRRAGFSLTCDWPRAFLRLAWDPKVNFTPQDELRLAGGWRF